MTRTLRALAASVVLAVAASPVVAQPAQPTQLSQPTPDLNALLAGATQAAQYVDAGRLTELWDNASPVVRRDISTAQFAAGMQPRLALGPAQSRRWVQTMVVNSAPGGAAPPGLYATIEFLSNFARRQDVRELVSLRFDEDQTWRLSGYASR